MKRELTIAIAVTGLCLPATLAAQTASTVRAAQHHAAGTQQHAPDAPHGRGGAQHAGGVPHDRSGVQHHADVAEHHAAATQHDAASQERHAVIAQHHDAAAQQPARATAVVAGTVETRITPGRPYSAEAVNETVQVLADGNRINRVSVTKVYRDSEGRTRRETLNEDGSVRTIAISDPVSHTSFTLDPKTKIAHKRGGNVIGAQGTVTGTYTLISPTRHPPAAGAASGGGRETMVGSGVGGYASIARGGGGAGAGGTLMRVPLHENENVQHEDVGPQNIEGVTATGKRTTTTIPAGQIGNAQEIKIVSERWFSDELEVLMMTKHSDPRSGETTYRLRNILRAEPDPLLFTVPADYTVQQPTMRELRK